MVSLNGTYLKPEINPRFLVALPDGISEKRDWAPYSCMPRPLNGTSVAGFEPSP